MNKIYIRFYYYWKIKKEKMKKGAARKMRIEEKTGEANA